MARACSCGAVLIVPEALARSYAATPDALLVRAPSYGALLDAQMAHARSHGAVLDAQLAHAISYGATLDAKTARGSTVRSGNRCAHFGRRAIRAAWRDQRSCTSATAYATVAVFHRRQKASVAVLRSRHRHRDQWSADAAVCRRRDCECVLVQGSSECVWSNAACTDGARSLMRSGA